ncbi:melanoma-associated antigen 11-like [Manis pentadactyla]|uniref:melanoma-associated antigen 11-like n=1 Tax=Manis pentadactyla TaxID=143292 RepID=UPI00255D11AE|nr:melanoma-associated antigen 11-like [Manis pentadactyla]XP_057351677.1 melanoma-associated antigen 11-like [Manis pentadactyla]XP_057351678.1 melanoma-associated antigen 11-like [Manis pentadactyla]XP_057351679.1 melanoma-associated antigen 11-like [Manis pentadactyla]XP_057351680.1 melanoma-associated antigen 11-like [Manis pentadactyla]XP_057351681.1 melanoma-associated antigen 11-like [Manis pentadactyla]XP_057351682.1 melanoma-associated antigen 11-like [Manis pentadactyla]XP_05735168
MEDQAEPGDKVAIPLSSVSMPLGAWSVQCPLEEAQQEASEDQGLEGAQPSPQDGPATLGSEPHAHSSSSHGDEAAGDARASLQDALRRKEIQLVTFLLHKYRTKEPTTKAEMLELVAQDHQDHFPDILSRASLSLELTYGIDVKEVDPSSHSYVLVPTLGLTWDGVTEEQRLPKTGLLALLLGKIFLWGGRIPEKYMWEILSARGVYSGREHCIFGEPRELITRVWVQEQYLEYRQAPDSNPARFHLLWGPRAHAEASRVQVQQFLLRLLSTPIGPFLCPSEEARTNEEQGP